MTMFPPRCILRSAATRRIVFRRQLSTSRISEQTRFSYYALVDDKPCDILRSLLGNAVLENPQGHNAALVLATPDFTKQLDDQAFNSKLASLLYASGGVKDFHLVCAIVDNIAPALGEPVPMPGISVLRGKLDDVLPELWQPSPPLEKSDKDAVAALIFKIGLSTQTLPLARTTFLNNRASTLLASRFELSHGTLTLKQRRVKQWQHVQLALDKSVRSVADFGLWAPLSPVTQARRITESFGNIIRGVEVGDKPTPASEELEVAINTMSEHGLKTEATSGPVGVWALVTLNPSTNGSLTMENSPRPSPTLEGKAVTRADIESYARYLQKQYQSGGRLYQVLSGGGGWGSKKGLLSLDPRETYFAPSEEAQMDKFMQTMDNSSFAPPGAYIQFFVPIMAPAEMTAISSPGIVFGVPLGHKTTNIGFSKKGYLVAEHFGALSTQGIFSSADPTSVNALSYDSKLNVPGSRIYFAHADGQEGGCLFQFLGGGVLADAGTVATAM